MNNDKILDVIETHKDTIECIDTMVMEVPTNVACNFNWGSIGLGTGNAGQPQVEFKFSF